MRLRRKSKKEERRDAVEQELVRRAREKPAAELPDGLTPLDFDAEREYGDLKNATDRAARAAELRAIPELDSVWPIVCSEHLWSPPPRLDGGPQPPKSRCPFCIGEHEARKNTKREVVTFEEPLANRMVPLLTPRQQELSDRADRAQAMRNGVRPGSDLEDAAVDYLDDAREDVIREDHGQRARSNVAYESMDGSRVVYRKPARRRARPTWSQVRAHVRLGLFSETELPE
jgi:hypothetical protein